MIVHVLEFDTQEKAEKRSSDEAAKRLGSAHTTELWWGWIERNGKFYLLCDPDTNGSVEMDL